MSEAESALQVLLHKQREHNASLSAELATMYQTNRGTGNRAPDNSTLAGHDSRRLPIASSEVHGNSTLQSNVSSHADATSPDQRASGTDHLDTRLDFLHRTLLKLAEPTRSEVLCSNATCNHAAAFFSAE